MAAMDARNACFRVLGLEFRLEGLGFWVKDSRFGISGLGFRVSG
jgi:hypothetical protein